MDFDTILTWLALALAALFALRGVALEVVKRTATPVDDRIVGKVYKWLEFVAGVLPARFKATIAMRPGDPKPPKDGPTLQASPLAVLVALALGLALLAGCTVVGEGLRSKAETPPQLNLELLARYDAIQTGVLGLLRTETVPIEVRREIRTAEQTARAAVLAHDRAIAGGAGDRESLARAAVSAIERLLDIVRARTGRDLALRIADPPGRGLAVLAHRRVPAAEGGLI
ncbi:hypothetical protein [Minwuia thermotolerans]|uniref:Uncharacterized protein n=1 Tax=Minwuia thermotolerans TaxID=2056226 RepID=A0A2M9G2M8_9PROT|nr:hypothetical protein [Minwuia thermotolerans]PJK29977.1 hypothetical protein CVT23_09425 [Minwuia thermotolerans]